MAKTGPKKEFVKQYSYHPGDEPPTSSPWPEAPAAPSARRPLSVLELLDFPASQLGCSIQTARRRPRHVRTAYRKHLHPDPRPTHEKPEAERQFKEAEAVFDKLFTVRGLV